ncbi:MAG: hypothetical protein COA58_04505 [Bacteroidetes bacterium]|nr:MAG: hypothetical protein COA58_04505 [Bacteroidota bacterium]
MKNKNIFEHFWDCITTNYATFNGRARRKEYWSFVLVNFLVGIVIGTFDFILTDLAMNHSSIISLGMLTTLGLFIPNLAVSIRRFHDTNKNGAIPLVFSLFSLVYYILFFLVSSRQIDTRLLENMDWDLMLPVSIVLGLTLFGFAIYLLIIYFTDGTKGPNKYGLSPKYPNPETELEQIGTE